MNVKTSLLCSIPVLALPLVAFSLRADEVSFHPAAGVAVSKELTVSSTFYVDDISAAMDGSELPPQMMEAAMEEGIMFEALIEVTDEYVSTQDGKLLTLLRTFDNLALEAGPESGAESVDEFGELEDSTVHFQWDEESGEYVKSFHEGDGEEDLLEGLLADMDLLALLPDGEVSEGDTWEATGEGLATVFLPGGIPAASTDEDDESAELNDLFEEEIEAQFEEAFEGFAVSCTYAGTREEGDLNLGVIEYKFEGTAAIDLSDLLQAAIDMQGEQMGGLEADIMASIDMEFEGEGTLLWNLEAGHISSFEMNGELTLIVDIEADIEANGESHSGELSAEISSEMAWAMTAEGGSEE